jgi:hypothetical protein
MLGEDALSEEPYLFCRLDPAMETVPLAIKDFNPNGNETET